MAKKTVTTNRKKTRASPPYIKNMTIVIEREGETSKHRLYFRKHELTPTEMYDFGFLGDIEFEHPSGVIEKVELEAGPRGSFEGDELGRFVFRLRRVDGNAPLNAHVVKFNFSKTP